MTQSSATLDEKTIQAARNKQSELGNPFNRGTGRSIAPIAALSKMDRVLEGTLTGDTSYEILSKREKQVLDFILAGHTNREIAQKLYRTERTVEYHRNRLMHKLGTHTPAELVRRAIAMGIA